MTTTYTPNALYRNKWDLIAKASAGTEVPGDIAVMDDGRIAVFQGLEAGASGDWALWKIAGQFDISSASGTTFSAGADVWWNTSTLLAVTAAAANCVYAGKATKAKTNGQLAVRTNINMVDPIWTGLAIGSSAAHEKDATAGGSQLAIYADPTATTGRYNTVRAESLLVGIGLTSTSPGLYCGRFVAGAGTGTTSVASGQQGYIAGVQGKLTAAADAVLGDGASGGIYACAGLAQVQFTSGATFGGDVQVYGMWVDNQTGANWPTLSHLLNLTNNGGTIRDVIHIYGNGGKFTNLMTMESMGSVVGTQSGISTLAKNLKIVIDGTPYYIPLCSGTS